MGQDYSNLPPEAQGVLRMGLKLNPLAAPSSSTMPALSAGGVSLANYYLRHDEEGCQSPHQSGGSGGTELEGGGEVDGPCGSAQKKVGRPSGGRPPLPPRPGHPTLSGSQAGGRSVESLKMKAVWMEFFKTLKDANITNLSPLIRVMEEIAAIYKSTDSVVNMSIPCHPHGWQARKDHEVFRGTSGTFRGDTSNATDDQLLSHDPSIQAQSSDEVKRQVQDVLLKALETVLLAHVQASSESTNPVVPDSSFESRISQDDVPGERGVKMVQIGHAPMPRTGLEVGMVGQLLCPKKDILKLAGELITPDTCDDAELTSAQVIVLQRLTSINYGGLPFYRVGVELEKDRYGQAIAQLYHENWEPLGKKFTRAEVDERMVPPSCQKTPGTKKSSDEEIPMVVVCAGHKYVGTSRQWERIKTLYESHNVPFLCAQDLDGLTPDEGENTARAAAEIPHESMSSMSQGYQGINSPSGDDGEDFATPASVDGHSALPSCPGDAGPPQTFEPRLFGPAYEMQRGRMSCGTIRNGGVGGMSGSSLKSVLTIVRNSVMSDYEMVDIGAGCGVVLLCSFAYGATLATGIEVKDDGLQHVLQACKPVLEAFSVPSCNICVHFGTDVSQCESLPTLQQGQSYQGPALPKVVFSFYYGFNVVDRQHCFRLVGLDANVKMFVCSPVKGSGAREEDVPVTKYAVHGGSASGTLDLTLSPACFPRSNMDSEYDNLQSVLDELQITHGLQSPINFPFTTGDCFFDALSVVMNNGTSAQQLRDATVRTIVNALKNADENAWRQYGYDICNNGGPRYVSVGGHYVLAMGNPGEIWASSFMVDSCASGLGLRLRIFTVVHTASGVYRISSRYSGAIAGEVLNLLYTGDEKGHFEPLILKDKSYVSSRGSSMLGLSLPLVQSGLPYSPPSRNAIKEALVQFGCLGLYRKLQLRGHSMRKVILSHALWHFEVDALRNGIQLAEIVEEVAKQFVTSQRN
ncbi:hypothetical protein CEUSTIGMA_g13283.t1 [Chlamydomonas eustigma]|uniref:OTU domain-containing protein n=1 Tax=Chlamydomonas eustigma TaxID=1157962 RepID=A0A250XS04_9CHLO|nr:hypothetical protein CEUSTIGMA_g13283.t1 [Chlamydomonas eustigma]|eukprot:GAX85867.1 hypothetical protein CEUSTIGMA_g13283.t1 [Chlamydomonas eustigma]